MTPPPGHRSGCLNNLVRAAGQLGLMLFLAGVFIVIDFWPTYGAPFFRYTGSNPDDQVWNLGFPIAWFIYDDNTPPHWFTAIPQVAYGLMVIQVVILLACAALPWLFRRK